MSTNFRCGATSGLVAARAFATSPLAAYSSAARTPRSSIRLIVTSGGAPGALRTNSASRGNAFRCSDASARPGAEVESVTKGSGDRRNGWSRGRLRRRRWNGPADVLKIDPCLLTIAIGLRDRWIGSRAAPSVQPTQRPISIRNCSRVNGACGSSKRSAATGPRPTSRRSRPSYETGTPRASVSLTRCWNCLG